MARGSGTSVENSFVKGFVTEYSGFNFPENACEETLNCVYNVDGSVVRRLGIALDAYDNSQPISYNNSSTYTHFIWKSAGLKSEDTFLVQQIDNILHFYRVDEENIPANKTTFTFDLNTYNTSSEDPGDYRCDYSNGSGRLFVSNNACDTFYLKYDTTTNSLTSSKVTVKIRDFRILEDGYDIIENMPYSVTDPGGPGNPEYVYNIRNQGWTTTTINGWRTQGNNEYPNKAQVWWYFRDPAQSGATPPYLQFLPSQRYKYQDLGTTVAPRGTFVLDAFDQDRNAVSGLTGLPGVSSNGKRPSCNAFINGRLFLSGVEADGYSGIVYFSNILKDVDTDIRFYQNGDPTSEVNPQLLANDGGVFIIPEAGKVIRMIPVKSTLVIFCTNGVWTVQGNEGVGFTATDFSIERISDEPCVDNESFVSVTNFPIWWSNEGIFTLQSSNVGAISTQQVTSQTIQTFYNAIPVECKKLVRGDYNTLTDEVYWLYSDDKNLPDVYNKCLVLNIRTQAFYLHSIPTNFRIVDIVATPLVDFTTYDPDALQNAKFVTEHSTNKIGFARFSNQNLLDWEDLGLSLPYQSYFITGPRVRGEGQRKFQETYVTVFSDYKVNSSCWMFSIWDWSNSALTSRWSTPQQVIKQTSLFNSFSRRLKIRGNGKAVQFKFESEDNKPFKILGWSAFETINERV